MFEAEAILIVFVEHVASHIRCSPHSTTKGHSPVHFARMRRRKRMRKGPHEKMTMTLKMKIEMVCWSSVGTRFPGHHT